MPSLIVKKVWYIPLKKKKKQKKNTHTHNRKQTKIAKISSDSKLSSWRLMAQQSDWAERQQYLELSP